MEKIGLVIDEGADLSQEIIEKHEITVVPVKLDWPELKEMPGENTFQKMRELEKQGSKSFGKTSQPSPKDFLDRFQAKLEKFDKVLSISITSKLSGTYNSSIQAKNFLKPEDQGRVYLLDSLNASAGQSLVALRAIELIEKGQPIEEIMKDLEKLIPQVRLFVMLEDPKWQEASGRISHLVANLMRRMAKLGIRPLLTFKKGVLVPSGIKTGAKDIPTALFGQFKKESRKLSAEGKRIRAVITHGDDLAGAQRLKEMVEKEFKNTEVAFLNVIDNVVGSLTGPNSMAFAWCEL